MIALESEQFVFARIKPPAGGVLKSTPATTVLKKEATSLQKKRKK
jgi:hypothetical protein